MSEKDTVYSANVKQTGLFDFKEFYKFAYEWLASEGYDITEKAYSEKVSGDSKDIDIEWEATKKISDYFKFVIKMDWQIIGMKKTKVKKDEKEISINSGQVVLRLKAVIVKDYEDRWENQPLWKFLRGVYERYIIRNRIEDYEDRILEEIQELINQCKSFLAIDAKH